MEKTIDQWLKEWLTEEEYQDAVSSERRAYDWDSYKFKSFKAAMSLSFVWDSSKKGQEYWSYIYENRTEPQGTAKKNHAVLPTGNLPIYKTLGELKPHDQFMLMNIPGAKTDQVQDQVFVDLGRHGAFWLPSELNVLVLTPSEYENTKN